MSSSFIFSPLESFASNLINKLNFFDKLYKKSYLRECKKSKSTDEIYILKALPFDSLDLIKVSDVSRCFRFDIPEEYRAQLNNYKFFSNDSESVNNDSVNNYNVIENFIKNNYSSFDIDTHQLIEQHIKETAKHFLTDLEKGKSKSNNTILGVHSIVYNQNKELKLEMFITDYFTYNCIIGIYKELYKLNKKPFIVDSLDKLINIYPFVCCCGIGGFLNLQYKGLLPINSTMSRPFSSTISGTLIAKRSNVAACPNHWHCSFDETFDIRDKATSVQGDKPSLKMCLTRGLYEELGINYIPKKHNIKNLMLFLIVNNNRLEAEFFTEIVIPINSYYDLRDYISRFQCASDAENENSNLLLVPTENVFTYLTNKKENNEQITPEALYFSQIYNQINNNKLLTILYKLKQLSL